MYMQHHDTNRALPRVVFSPSDCDLEFSGLTTKFVKPILHDDDMEDRGLSKSQFNLDKKNVYLCGQTMMKFHPDFDDVMLEILKLDDDGVVVITFNENQILWKDSLAGRLCRRGVTLGVNGFLLNHPKKGE